MGYVIAAILVVLIVGRGRRLLRAQRDRTGKGQATIAAPDEGTPLGTTTEHVASRTARRAAAGDTDRDDRQASAARARAAPAERGRHGEPVASG